MKYRIGIDVGGTNTDFVLLNSYDEVCATHKQNTTHPIDRGVLEGVQEICHRARISIKDIHEIAIGSTHALNALLQAKDLQPTGLIRFASQNPRLSGGAGLPTRLKENFFVGCETVSGGFECDGRILSPFDPDLFLRAVDRLVLKGAKGIALVSVFGSLFPDHEILGRDLIKQHYIEMLKVTCSHELGGIGFIERENAALINTALMSVVESGFKQLIQGLTDLGADPDGLYFIQNDGSRMLYQTGIDLPIKTLSCGPINSGRGGALLKGFQDCIVIDIGGTSTDICRVRGGFVQRSTGAVEIADVKLQCAAPDVVSLSIGGGSIVDPIFKNVGPESVAMNLSNSAVSFGGSVLTMTDLGLKSERLIISGAQYEHVSIEMSMCNEILDLVGQRIAKAAELVRGKEVNLPVIIVGGGALLVADSIKKYIYPVYLPSDIAHVGIANALGAAHSEMSGRSDGIVSLANRESMVEVLSRKAKQNAIDNGADPDQVRIVNMEITPFAYTQDNLTQISLLALGPRRNTNGNTRGNTICAMSESVEIRT